MDDQTADFFNPPDDAPPAPPADDGPILLGAPDDSEAMMDFASPSSVDDGGDFIGDVDATDAPIVLGAPPPAAAPPVPEDDDDDMMMGFASAPAPEPSGVAVTVEEADDGEEGPAAEEEPEEEPELSPMAKWNQEWQITLMNRKDNENAVKGEHVEKAREDMEKFQAAREAKREARMKRNRIEEQEKLEAIEADLENDNSWQRVCKLVEMSHDADQGAADVSRMRDVMILLKNEASRATALS